MVRCCQPWHMFCICVVPGTGLPRAGDPLLPAHSPQHRTERLPQLPASKMDPLHSPHSSSPTRQRYTHPLPRVPTPLSSTHPVWLRTALPRAPWQSRPPSPPLGTRARCSPEPANTNSIAWADPSPHGHAHTDITGRTEPPPVGTFPLGWAASLERGWDRGALGKEKVLDWPVGHRTSWSGHRGRELGAQSPTGEAGPMASRSLAQHPPAPACCSSLPGAFKVAAQGRTWVREPQAARQGWSAPSPLSATVTGGSVWHQLSMGLLCQCLSMYSGAYHGVALLWLCPCGRVQRCQRTAPRPSSTAEAQARGSPRPATALRASSRGFTCLRRAGPALAHPTLHWCQGLSIRGWGSRGNKEPSLLPQHSRASPRAPQTCSNPAASSCRTSFQPKD